jgi:putative ABC transport system permease protein
LSATAKSMSGSGPGALGQFKLALKMLLRDWRSGELTVLLSALVIAVTSLTAVAFLTDRVSQSVEMRAAESLAADLRLASTEPIPEAYSQEARSRGLRTARITSMPSVVFSGEPDSPSNTLAAVRAASQDYPLRGKLRLSDQLLGDEYPQTGAPAPGEAWASPRLLTRLDVDVGARIEIGETSVTVTRVLVSRPDEGFRFTDLAPTLLISEADLEAAGLIQPGSRVAYRALFSGSRPQVDEFKVAMESMMDEGEDLQDIQDANPQIRSAMDRSGRFLNLASLVSVLLAAVAVAMSARRYSHRHRDRVALMKCLGASQGQILATSLVQIVILALIAGVVGAVLGFLSHSGLAWLMRDMIQQTLPLPGWAPVWLGLVTAVLVLAGFALPDLLQLRRTPPLRVLRHDIAPPPIRYGMSWIAAIGAILALLLWIVGDSGLVLMIFGGIAVTFALLAVAGWMLVRSLQGFRAAAGVAWRFGLANLARRGRESIAQVVAFGLGLMVLLLLTTVRNELMDNWRANLPEDAPNQFLINIQGDEVAGVQAFFAERGLGDPRLAPMVRGRMSRINGESVIDMTFPNPQGKRWARRDANLSWASEPQIGNRVISGNFWADDLEGPQISIEQDFATDLGVGLGDTLEFDVAGEAVEGQITSVRDVEWDSFRPNFFVVFSPGVLEEYPASWITSVHVEEPKKAAILDLMRKYPSVTAIDLDAVLGQVRDVMDKASLAVQAVFVFTLLAGLIVLWAAVQATRDERRYESAMLRTLGATRSRVLLGVATEFVAIGLLAGVLAAGGASLVAWLFSTRLLELEYSFSIVPWVAGPLFGMLMVGVSGMIATWRVVARAPVSVLRHA